MKGKLGEALSMLVAEGLSASGGFTPPEPKTTSSQTMSSLAPPRDPAKSREAVS
ncbi:hypothetical protein KKA00_05325 [bacterium]|nr:hypothetical protein [bacterium]